MPAHTDLAVSYHQQDTSYYCGAACAQMVLDQVGMGLLDQAGLYNDNHSHSTTDSLTWYTAPDGLAWTLNNRQSTKYFCLDALSSEDAISRMIVWTIHHYQVAPVALVFGWAHWIVVRGYTTSADPTYSADTSYTISGFDVNNPDPPTPTPGPPPPHSNTDNCGSGGARGISDEHIGYTQWRSTYMTGVPSGYWSGKFVAICDPDPPAEWGPRPASPGAPPPDAELLDREAVIRFAREGLEAHGLLERERWRRAFDREPERPQLVERLDRLDEWYAIVPSGGEGGGGLVAVDARTGAYLQSAMIAESPQRFFPVVEEQEERVSVALQRPIELPLGEGVLRPRGGLVAVYPHLVWRPCLESLSPFYPFRMIIAGAHRIYVRIADGAIFTTLTTDVRGA